MERNVTRRDFLSNSLAGISAVWLSANLPELLAASARAREAAKSPVTVKLEFFTPEQAVEVEAITARIIPTDDMPGAREAGVVYFIDRALATFASEDQKTYREGLPELQARVQEVLPGIKKFSSATPEQQDEVLHSFDENAQARGNRAFRSNRAAHNFFEALRAHTIVGFLLDPDSGGDPKGIGWKVIGREREHMFQPPFGYYDKDYPGWQPNSPDTEKK